MFDYFRANGNLHKKLQKAVYGIVIEFLLKDLTSYQKKILRHKHWHYSDPNYPEDGKMISLLERLIDDACFEGRDFEVIDTKLFIHSLKDMVGLEKEEAFKKQIEAINNFWAGYASISYKDKHLSFKMNLQK